MNAILIPAYKPDEKLVALCQRLLDDDELKIVVVDDGSGTEYKEVFDALDRRVHVIRYPINRGKGWALKTGMEYIYNSLPECERLVTADADGQHRYEDIQKVIAQSVRCPGSLILGSRRFDTNNVPARSRFGNAMTRGIFHLVSGVKVYDTQTGLRGFDRTLMESLMHVKGDRYEYEMNMLLDAAEHRVPILEVTIRTVYLNENESSHFSLLKDSAKIYYCLLKYFVKFLAVQRPVRQNRQMVADSCKHCSQGYLRQHQLYHQSLFRFREPRKAAKYLCSLHFIGNRGSCPGHSAAQFAQKSPAHSHRPCQAHRRYNRFYVQLPHAKAVRLPSRQT